MAIGIVILLGLGMIYGGVSARGKESSKAKPAAQTVQTQTVAQATELPPPTPPPDTAGSAFCPFCAKSVKKTCPKCGKQVENDFVACP